MTDRSDGLPQSYIMHHVYQRTICRTPGCHTFVVDRVGDLCLACQLDQDLLPLRRGRPPKLPKPCDSD